MDFLHTIFLNDALHIDVYNILTIVGAKLKTSKLSVSIIKHLCKKYLVSYPAYSISSLENDNDSTKNVYIVPVMFFAYRMISFLL